MKVIRYLFLLMWSKYNWGLVMKILNIYFILGGVTENLNLNPKTSLGKVNRIEN